ncbi:MAG: hypothetical protein P1U54_03370 [Immundisolibacteraceae bacterium]|nr:hypothetical protein [Immundisolibacteraceae bacterium]
MKAEEIDLFDYEFKSDRIFADAINQQIRLLRTELTAAGFNTKQDIDDFFLVFKRVISRLEGVTSSTLGERFSDAIYYDNKAGLFLLIGSWKYLCDAIICLLSPYESYENPCYSTDPNGHRRLGKPNIEVGLDIIIQSVVLIGVARESHHLKYTHQQARLANTPPLNQPSIQRLGGRSASSRFDIARDVARAIAEDAWADLTGPIPTRGQVAKGIIRVFIADLENVGLKKTPSIQTVKNWISGLAPAAAKKPGRPKTPKR